MSLITRCPACRTMFKVVPDQLRISEGWVRCGQCEEIFNASAHMQASGSDVAEPAEHDDQPASALAALAPELNVAPDAPEAGTDAGVDFELHDDGQDDAPVDEAVPFSALLPDGSAYGAAAPAAADTARPRGSPSGSDAPEPTPSQLAELSFMRRARKASRWHRPLVRAVLSVFALLLMLGLGLQVAVQERDRIAAVAPAFKPHIAEICRVVGCTIGPLRQIESIAIDSSAFSRVRPGVYRLSLTLKNTAPTDLAMPSVELTLTDTLDHALVRRVIGPEELGLTAPVIGARSEMPGALTMSVKSGGNTERIAGYRVIAFYP